MYGGSAAQRSFDITVTGTADQRLHRQTENMHDIHIPEKRLKRTTSDLTLAVLAWAAISSTAHGADAPAAPSPEIHIEDVERFYEIYDAANGRPTAEQLQRDYIDAGSEGLHTLARLRNVTGARIAETLAKNPQIYSKARRCMAVLPRVKERVQVALGVLARLNPDAQFPSVTVAVSRGKPAGIGYPDTGIQIGLEAVCAADFLNPDVEDRFVHLISHEYVHVQQAPALAATEDLTVLERSLLEGIAEMISELISGLAGQAHFPALTEGREKEIEMAFLADQDKTDLSAWLDNSTMEKPGDLGYWVGHRIAKSYYQHATDKRQAVHDIFQTTDAKAFLEKSGWYPGIKLQ